MNNENLIKNFLEKFFFILKAASDGWRISYIGGNKFCFYKNLNTISCKDVIDNKFIRKNFIKKYKFGIF